MSRQRDNAVQGWRAQLQWWLGASLAVAVGLFGYLVFVRDTGDAASGRPTLPAFSCPGASTEYRSDQLTVFYRESGCERVYPDLPVKAGETISLADAALSALRLPRVPRPLQVGLYTQPLPPGGYQLDGDPGEARAISITTDPVEDAALKTNATKAAVALSLSELAPSLTSAQLRDLAAAYARIISPNTEAEIVLTPAQRELVLQITSAPPDQVPERLVSECSVDRCELSQLTR